MRGGSEVPGPEAMLVEDGAVIDEVLRLKRQERRELKDQMQSRKSTKALFRTAIGAREKAVIKLEGLQKEEADLTQLLLLKQQEIVDAKNDAADKAREVEMLQAKRLAEVDCDGSVSHGSSASISSPKSPQQWALGLAASLPEDVRVKFEDWCSSVGFDAKASVYPVLGGSEPGVSSDSTRCGSCLADTDCDDFSGIQIPCCQSSFLLATGCAFCCGVSDEQESGAVAGSGADVECSCHASAVGVVSRTSAFSGPARVTAGPAEQAFKTCTVAEFSRRVHLDKPRGRGLMKGLKPEILEQISSWPSALAHGCEACTQIIAYTDGSACMTRVWPKLGGGGWMESSHFAVDASGAWSLAGGAWGPVETDHAAQSFLGASRPTSPVAEVTAIASVLRMLRAARVSIP